MTADIKKIYLIMPLKRWEYIKLQLSDIPAEVVKEYDMMEKATKNGSIEVEVRKRNVRTTPIRIACPRTTYLVSSRVSILPKQNNSRTLAPQDKTHHLHTGSM